MSEFDKVVARIAALEARVVELEKGLEVVEEAEKVDLSKTVEPEATPGGAK